MVPSALFVGGLAGGLVLAGVRPLGAVPLPELRRVVRALEAIRPESVGSQLASASALDRRSTEFHPSSGSRSGRRAIRPEASGAVVHHAFSEALVSLTDWPTPIATMIIVSVTPSDSSHNVAATPGRLIWQPADRRLLLWSPPDDNGSDPLGCLERVFEFSESENLPAGLAEL